MSDHDATPELRNLVERIVTRAKKLGAKEADALAERSRQSTVSVRNGEIEELSESASKGVGVRVIRAGRLGFASTTDFSDDGIDRLVERALAVAKESAPDEANAIASAKELRSAPRVVVKDLFDPEVAELDPGWKVRTAYALEKAARAEDARCDNFEGSGAGEGVSEAAIASTHGLVESERGTSVYLWCAPVAKQDDQLQTASWADSQRHLRVLDSADAVGREAARRTVRMLGAKRIDSGRMPVVFDPLNTASFFGSLLGAVNGDLVYKKSSFLGDKLGQRVASSLVTLVDDPHLAGGLGSTAFDGEGIPTRRTPLLEAGVLRTFLYDVRTARKAKTAPTGHARRGYSGLPGIGSSNLRVEAGKTSPEEIVKGVKRGLYVTHMLGRGANVVTGDYSRGANGILIEDGVLTYPVMEITVAGHLLEMLQRIDAVGTDVTFRGSIGAPTIRFAELAVGGA